MGRGIVIQIEVDEHGSVQGVQRIARELNALDGSGRRASGGVSSAEKSLSRLNGQIAKFASLAAAGYAIKSISNGLIGAANAAESYSVRLGVLLRSQEEGSRMFGKMADYAGRVPFTYQEVMESATSLSGIMKGGVDEVNKWIPLVGDLAAATGLSLQETTGQVIRMYSAGAASADLFRERGVLSMLGFEAGVTYSAEETRKKLLESWTKMDSQFRGATEGLARTVSGKWSMIQDAWFKMANKIADSGLWNGVKSKLDGVILKIDELDESGKLDQFAKDFALTVTESLESASNIAGDITPLITKITGSLQNAIDAYNTLPSWVQEIGIVGAIVGGKKVAGLVIAGSALSEQIMQMEKYQSYVKKIAAQKELELGGAPKMGIQYDTDMFGNTTKKEFYTTAQIQSVIDAWKRLEEKNKALSSPKETANAKKNSGAYPDDDTTVKNRAKKAAEQLLAIQQQYADWKVSVMDDGLAKEFATMNNWYDKEKAEAAGNTKALAVLEQQKTDWKMQIVSDWQSKMEKEQKEYDEEDKKRAQKQAEDIAQIMAESNALQISMIQDPRTRAFAEIDQWLSEYERDHQGNSTAISIAEQFAKDKKVAYDLNAEVERTKKLTEEAQQRWLDFGGTIENVLYDALTTSGNVFENIASAFGDMLDRMLAEIAARAAAFAILNVVTGGAASARTGKSFLDVILSGFASGGYTGYGDRREVAGLVHRNEYVIPARTVDAYGTSFFDSIVSGRMGNTSNSNSTTANFYITSNGTTTRVKGNSSEMKTVLKQVFRDNPDLRRELLGRA